MTLANLFYIKTKNPLHTYNKVKHFFLKPKIKINFGFYKFHNKPKIFYLKSEDVSWKEKQNYSSFEKEPYILLILFNVFYINIRFNYIINRKNYDDQYWETILDFIYFNNSLNTALEENEYSEYIPNEKNWKKIYIPLLRNELQELYNECKLNNNIYYDKNNSVI